MAEFRLGRLKFNWTGEWASNRAYVLDDIISFKGNTYVCVVNHTSTASQEAWEDTDLNANPSRWELYVPGVRNAGAWTANTFYAKNDLVRYGGNIFICKDNHTSPNNENLFYATNFAGNWDLFLNGNENKGTWQATTWYKVNDLVKYGNNIYLCNIGHTSTSSFDITKFSVYLEAVKFEDSWSDAVEYQPGDIVLFGGYSYTAKTINTNKQPNNYVNTDWEVISVGFDSKGNYNPSTIYVPGDVVRYGGNTFVKLLTSVAGIAPNEVGDGALKWSLISEGLSYKGDWDNLTTYQKNDVITLASSTYVSIAYNNTNRNPSTNDADGFWAVVARGDEESTITVKGDLLYRATATNARLPVGSPGQILYATENGIPGWGNAKTRKVYFVNLDGVDDLSEGYGGSIGRAFRTVKYASQIAAQEGCDEQNPATIYVKAGVYDEECPITIPPYCSVVGDDSRGTIIEPAPGVSKIQRLVIASTCLLKPGDTLTVNTLAGPTRTARVLHFADTDATSVGAGEANRKKMVYVETIAGGPIIDTDTFLNGTNPGTAPQVDIVSVTNLDNTKATLFFLSEGVMLKDLVFNNPDPNAGFIKPDITGLTIEEEITNTLADITKCQVGFVFWRINPFLVSQVIIKSPYIYSCAAYCHKGVGAIVDGSVNEGKDHPSHFAAGHQSLLFGNVTQFPEEGVAIWCKDNGNSEIVSCFTYYSHIGYASSGGARMRSLGGNNSWGNFGCSARGFDPTEIPLEGTIRGTELNFYNAATTATATATVNGNLVLGTITQSGKVNGDFQVGSIISNEGVANDTSITGVVGNGTTATVSFDTKPFNPFVIGKKITVSGVSNSAFNGTFTITGVVGTQGVITGVRFASTTTATLGAGGTVRPALGKARVLYVLAGNDYTKVLIEPITGFIGDGQRCAQITGADPNNPPPVNIPTASTLIANGEYPAADNSTSAANRATRGAKFAVINLSEKPKITSAVTFANSGDGINYVIQEIENYSDGPSASFRTLDVTRTASLQNSVVTIPIAKTGTFPSGVNRPAETHIGGTDISLYSLLTGTNNQVIIDNPGDLLTSTSATNINILNPERVTAALATYNTASTTLYLLVGNELMLPSAVVDDAFNSYVTVTRGQEGTIAQEHADQDSPNFPQNAVVRFVVKYTPVTTLRQDANNLANVLSYSTLTGNGGLPVFSFTDQEGAPTKTIVEGDFIKIDNEFFRVDLKTSANPGTAILTFFPVKLVPEASGNELQIRYRYSQIRLTGHDMLEIGTGGIATTNFPDEPIIRPDETKETNFIAPARIYYVTTNQDGNFKVGQFFKIDQATGKSTLDASAFDLTGLSNLQFALPDGTKVGVEINKFDADGTLGGTETSDSFVPTQKAVKTYVDTNFISSNSDVTVGTELLNKNFKVFGNSEITGDTIIGGSLQVSGTTTSINTTEIVVEDVNITLAAGNVTGDSAIQGAGLTIKGSTDKTITYDGSSITGRFVVSENVLLAPGKYLAAKPALADGTGALATEEIMIDTNVNGSTGIGLVFPTIAQLDIGNASTALTIGGTTGTTSVRNSLVLPGSSTLAPLRFTPTGAGLLGSPLQGGFEYNQIAFYATPTTESGRGIILAPHILRASADFAQTSVVGAAVRNVFSPTTADAAPLRGNTLYRFRGVYYLSKSTTTSGTWNLLFTFTNTPTNFRYTAIGANSNSSSALLFMNTTATTTTAVTQAVATTADCAIQFEGYFVSNATTGGTLTPQFNKSDAATSTHTTRINSYFEIQAMGPANPSIIAGNWS
jgi:hypothetical protein